jgi:putative DNA primase/helicase
MEIQMNTSTETTSAPDAASYTQDFTEEIQQRIVAMMIYDQEAFLKVKDIIKPEYFESPVLADLVRIILAYHKEYSQRIDIDELTQELDVHLDQSKRPLPREVYTEQFIKILLDGAEQYGGKGFKYVLDQVVAWSQYQLVKIAILESINLLQKKRDYNGILEKIKEAVAVGMTAGDLDVVDLADVERKEVEWFWHQKIPRAKLSLIVGDPSTGKSWFTMFLAACVTTGSPLPHSAHQTARGRVVILSAEDDPEDTIVPRLEDCGGDKSLAHIIRGTKQGKMFNLAEDLDRLRAYLQAKGGVRLIIIDPISAYIGTGNKVNSHKDTDVRGILSPVVKLAKDFDVTIIGVMHLNKSQDLGAIYRVSGSMAFVAQARAVWLMTQEDREGEDTTLRYFSPVKANLSAVKEGLVWRVQNGRPEFFDPGFQPPSIKDQLGPRLPERSSKLDEATRWLQDLLKDGQAMEQAEILRLATAEGISRTTLDRAKKELGVKSEKLPGGASPWTWVMPKPTSEN